MNPARALLLMPRPCLATCCTLSASSFYCLACPSHTSCPHAPVCAPAPFVPQGYTQPGPKAARVTSKRPACRKHNLCCQASQAVVCTHHSPPVSKTEHTRLRGRVKSVPGCMCPAWQSTLPTHAHYCILGPFALRAALRQHTRPSQVGHGSYIHPNTLYTPIPYEPIQCI